MQTQTTHSNGDLLARRVVGSVIDTVIYISVFIGVVAYYFGIGINCEFLRSDTSSCGTLLTPVIIFHIIFIFLWLVSFKGRTPGEIIMGVTDVGLNGERVVITKKILRLFITVLFIWLFYLLTSGGQVLTVFLFVAINFIGIILSKGSRTLIDIIVGIKFIRYRKT